MSRSIRRDRPRVRPLSRRRAGARRHLRRRARLVRLRRRAERVRPGEREGRSARSTSPRMPARPSTASTCFSSPRIASRRSIPQTGRVLAHDPGAGRRRRLGLDLGGRDALGRALSRAQDPSGRSRDRRDPPHDRVQPLRHRRHLDRRRALARHLGRRRERAAARRPSNRRGPGAARDAARHGRVGPRIRWRRSVLLRRRQEREGEGRPPAEASAGLSLGS